MNVGFKKSIVIAQKVRWMNNMTRSFTGESIFCETCEKDVADVEWERHVTDHIPEKLRSFGKSAQGNFRIIDTIGVPHSYCITHKHVAYTHDNHSGFLTKFAIEQCERNKIYCEICVNIQRETGKKILMYAEHKQALAVECNADPKIAPYGTELQIYLLKHDKQVEKEYAGFVLIKKF